MQKRILVVGNAPASSAELCSALSQAGYEAKTANSGMEALKGARACPPDLVILDAALPDLTGFTFCEMLRRRATMASVPLVMLSSLPGELPRLTALRSGVNEYLPKPVTLEKLLSLVAELFGRPLLEESGDTPTIAA